LSLLSPIAAEEIMNTPRDGWFVRVSALILAGAVPASAGDAPPAAKADAGAIPQLGMIMEQNGGSLYRAQKTVHDLTEPPSADEAKPDSPPGTYAAVSLFAVAAPKPKTFKKHDLITVIAKENSAFTANGNENLTKTQDFDSQLNSFIALRPSTLQLHSIISGGSNFPQIQNQNERDYKGTGEVDRTDTFSDRFTAEVVDVKPNGTLVLQAIKQIKTDEEEQRMVVTGICRAEDVSADNTVLTTQLFDLELTQTHTGAVNDTTQRGFLPRLLDTFSPF
jgi:flagellar L-ring protein FlgH